MQASRTAWKRPGDLLSFPAKCLTASSLFHGLSSAGQEEIAAAARVLYVPSQHTIFREDDPVRAVHVLACGSVKVTQLSQSGREVILRVDRAGSLIDGIGDATARVHSTTACAMSACRVLSWDVVAFGAYLNRFPAIQRNVTVVLTKRLKALEERFCEVTTNRVPQRLARVLLQLAEPNQLCEQEPVGLSREELAQMTGTSLFTVSRMLSDWAERGIVQVDRKAVVVEQLPRLVELAEDSAGLESGIRSR